jgi:beta-galactosidase
MTSKSFSLLKRKFIFILFIFSFASIEKTIAQNPERFFNKKDIMTIGSYYYPEHWPKKYWANDLKTMADVGFEFTHFGEFAWTFIEPE